MAKDIDIKKLQEEIKQLRKLVYHDELTGIYNRRGFLQRAERAFVAISYGHTELEKRVGFPIPFSVIFMDIDNFKKINDTYGHELGDKALKHVADVFNSNLRPGDFYGRWGGEEFIVAVVGADSKAAGFVAEKLREALEKKTLKAGKEQINLTGSFGVLTYTKEKNFSEMVQKADKAMYEAKKEGKNRVVIF